MSMLLLFAALCAGSAVGQVQVPCYGEGCINVTVYLGPRWGSKVIMVPRTHNTSMPRVGNEISGDRYEDYDEKYHRPLHRPVPEGGGFQVDFIDDEPPEKTTQNRWPSWWNPTTTGKPWWDQRWNRTTTTISTGAPGWDRGWNPRRWNPSTTTTSTAAPWWDVRRTIPTNRPDPEARVVFGQYRLRGTVDLSRRGYSGFDVKRTLLSLPEFDRKQMARLNLDGNKIQYLPVLVFPVELEYGLQELSLNDNLFSPPYLPAYTRFELSRLARLTALNMSRCGLMSLEMPYLPSLEILDLSYNKLTYLSTSVGRLSNLQQLSVRGNRISYLSNTVSMLTSLWVLDLSDNGLREFWGEPLNGLGSLVTIKLSNNSLVSLPKLAPRTPKVVYLANNSLQCSCYLIEWVRQPNIQLDSPYSFRCQDSDNGLISLYQLTSEEYRQKLCADDKSWTSRAWDALALWYRRNPDIMRNIYRGLGVMLVLAVLLVLVKRRRTVIEKMKPKFIPYNILDEQTVSTVSGPLRQV